MGALTNCCGNPQHEKIDARDLMFKPVDHQQRMYDILDFWFRPDNDQTTVVAYDRESSLPSRYMTRWFKQGDEFDEIVKKKFAQDFQNLKQNEYKEWESNHEGRLALIILCD